MNEKKFSKLISSIYDAALEPTKWQNVIDLLSSTLDGRSSLFINSIQEHNALQIYSLAKKQTKITLINFENTMFMYVLILLVFMNSEAVASTIK